MATNGSGKWEHAKFTACGIVVGRAVPGARKKTLAGLLRKTPLPRQRPRLRPPSQIASAAARTKVVIPSAAKDLIFRDFPSTEPPDQIAEFLTQHAGAMYPNAMYDYEITVKDAAILLGEGKARLVDVREPWEYATAKVDGSLPMPMGDVPSRAHQELDPDERLLLLCHHGARSLSVTNWLRQQGFEAAQSVAGGIDAWSCEVDPSIPRY